MDKVEAAVEAFRTTFEDKGATWVALPSAIAAALEAAEACQDPMLRLAEAVKAAAPDDIDPGEYVLVTRCWVGGDGTWRMVPPGEETERQKIDRLLATPWPEETGIGGQAASFPGNGSVPSAQRDELVRLLAQTIKAAEPDVEHPQWFAARIVDSIVALALDRTWARVCADMMVSEERRDGIAIAVVLGLRGVMKEPSSFARAAMLDVLRAALDDPEIRRKIRDMVVFSEN